jgi:hypothetical protein
MPLPEQDRRALEVRLAPAGAGAADVVAAAVDEGEELREILVDVHGDVVAFTNKRALFVADGAAEPVVVGYDEVEVRQRDTGLAIDALIEGGRLVLDVARGTFARLAVVGAGGPPGRATWLPVPPPPTPATPPLPTPPPAAAVVVPAVTEGPAPVTSPMPPPLPVSLTPPAPPAPAPPPPAPALADLPPPVPQTAPAPTMPAPTGPPMYRPDMPPPGWHPDPSRLHWWRWWDGQDWTDHVADGGPPSLDPLPPR